MSTLECVYCRDPLLEGTPLYRRCRGWERKGAGSARRGGSDIVLREQLPEYACIFCIDSLRHGRHPAQGGLPMD